MYSSYTDTKQRHGFTLVELLIVIVIIGMLASLVLVGGSAAISAARRGVVKSDITQLEMALESYKNKYGEYPPDFSDKAAVMRHVRKRWPRYSVNEKDFFQEVINAGWEVATIASDGTVTLDDKGVGYLGAVTFWLGGLQDGAVLGGFSADVSDPFNLNAQREQPMMEFTIDKNVNHDFGVYCFKAYKQPVVYFKADSYGYAETYIDNNGITKYSKDEHDDTLGCVRHCDCGDFGCAAPYAKSGTGKISVNGKDLDVIWHNQDKFQLIHPGLDNEFGGGDHSSHDHDHYAPLRFANPADEDFGGCSLADYDNQANFNGTTIEDK